MSEGKIYVLSVEMRGTDAEIQEAVGLLHHAVDQMSSTGFSAEIYEEDGAIVIEGASLR